MAKPLGGLKVSLRRQVHALALDRLDHECSDVAAFELARQRLLIAEGRRIARGRERPEAVPELGVAVERERTKGEAVEGMLGVEEPRPAGGRAGDLIAASTASAPVLAGTIAPTEPGARASSCSASTPESSVTQSCGGLPVLACITASTAATASGWLRPIANTP